MNMYQLKDFIEINDPLLYKGKNAIQKRETSKLKEVLENSFFDANSFTARALLYEAAEQANLEAFCLLGEKGVVLFDNDQEPLCEKKHALSSKYLPPISICLEETPLHVLFRKTNLVSLFNLNLSLYFKNEDLIKTFNTTASLQYQNIFSKDSSQHIDSLSPLDVLWQHYQTQCQFFEQKNDFYNKYNLSFAMSHFLSKCLQYIPDLTIPLYFERNTLLKEACYQNDLPCIYILANPTIALLNHIQYHFSEKDIIFFKSCTFVDPQLKNEMKCKKSPQKLSSHTKNISLWERIKRKLIHTHDS